RIKERRVLEEEAHFPAYPGEPRPLQLADLVLLYPNLSLIRFQQRNDQFQRYTLAGSTPPKNAQCFPSADAQRYIAQDLLRAKRFRYLIKNHCRSQGLYHRAVSGNTKKITLIRSTSRRMISNEEITTLRVAARPTPCAPSLVV